LALYIIGELLRALRHAHAAGVLHRDVTATNVLIATEGHVKLIDFGLATLIGASSAGSFGETVGYSAPEGPVSEGSDIYSAGKVFWTMVAGALAAPLPGNLDHGVAAFAQRLVHQDPSARYATADEALKTHAALGVPAANVDDMRRLLSQSEVMNDGVPGLIADPVPGPVVQASLPAAGMSIGSRPSRQAAAIAAAAAVIVAVLALGAVAIVAVLGTRVAPSVVLPTRPVASESPPPSPTVAAVAAPAPMDASVPATPLAAQRVHGKERGKPHAAAPQAKVPVTFGDSEFEYDLDQQRKAAAAPASLDEYESEYDRYKKNGKLLKDNEQKEQEKK
jgi:serine/threonine-protein kinase